MKHDELTKFCAEKHIDFAPEVQEFLIKWDIPGSTLDDAYARAEKEQAAIGMSLEEAHKNLVRNVQATGFNLQQPVILDGMKTGQGEKIQTEHGATRESNSGRGRFDLIPYESMEALAIWSEQGAVKYGDRNWEKGLSVKDCINRMIRHALKAGSGMHDEDHLAAVMWNASAAITMMKRRPDCNDHDWIAPDLEDKHDYTQEQAWVSCNQCGSTNVEIHREAIYGKIVRVHCVDCRWSSKYE